MRRALRWLLRGVLASVLAGLAFGAYLFGFAQEKLVYRPFPSSGLTPADFGLEFETVRLSTDDAETLHGWYLPAPSSRGVILYFRGNAGTMSHRKKALLGLAPLGLDILIFDYRGYGESTGETDEAGTYADAAAAWRHLTNERQWTPDRVVIWGRSLGGAVALGLAESVQPAAVVLESTFTSLPDLAVELYPFLDRDDVDIGYRSLARIGSVTAPLLYAHSPEDELIRYHHGAALFAAAASSTKAFVRMEGTHNAGHLTSPTYGDEVQAFLQRVLPPGRPPGRVAR